MSYDIDEELKRIEKELQDIEPTTENSKTPVEPSKDTTEEIDKTISSEKTSDNNQQAVPVTNSVAEQFRKVIAEADRKKQAEEAYTKQKPSKQSRGAEVSKIAVLEAKNITKYYGEHRIFENLSFTVDSGDIVGVIGENGAGKSTLFKVLTGITPHESGQIHINGLPLAQGRKFASVLWVDNGFDGNLTVKQNFQFYAKLYNIPYNEADIKHKLSQFGILKVLNMPFKYLSTGQRRKSAIVRSLLKTNAKIVFLDEATGGLDFSSQATFHRFVKEYVTNNENCGVILISHMLSDLENLCNKLLILEGGKILDYATVETIKKKYLIGFLITILVDASPDIVNAVSKVLENVEECQYVVKQTAEAKLVPVYIRFLRPLGEFNPIDKFLSKYVIQKTVRPLDLSAFLDLILAGVVFKSESVTVEKA